MSFPSIVNFGIVDNPLIDSPFEASNHEGNLFPPAFNGFLLLNTEPMALLNGDLFLLLNSE